MDRLAGPAVNVVIAALLSVWLTARHEPLTFQPFDRTGHGIAENLFQANVGLVLFNMIPAFPMDGGRVLRALLALSGMTMTNATNVAARIGQAAALLGGIWAVFFGHQFLYVFIAVFVYFGGGSGSGVRPARKCFRGRESQGRDDEGSPHADAGATLRDAAEQLLAGAQQDFPIVHGEEVVGLMTRDDLLRGLATEGQDGYVAGIMQRDFAQAVPGEDMSRLSRAAEGNDAFNPRLPLLVLDGGKLVGMVTGENLSEFFAIQQILSVAPSGHGGR